jgi:ATP-dependent DNA helicase RecG
VASFIRPSPYRAGTRDPESNRKGRFYGNVYDSKNKSESIYLRLHLHGAMDEQGLLDLLRSGEGQQVEFKRKSTAGVSQTACAFANTGGGVILVGISDEGRVVGVSPEEERRVSQRLSRLEPYPEVRVTTLPLAGKDVMVVEVEASKRLVTLGGVAYIRVGPTNRPLSINELVHKAIDLALVRLDEAPSEVPVDEVDEDAVAWYLERREEVRGVKARGTPVENLRALRAAVDGPEGPVLTYAGVLFFTPRPDEHVPGAALRVIRMDGDLNPVDTHEVNGPVWRVADEAHNLLVSMLGRVESRVGAARRSVLEYPEAAIREAVVNALAHRHYGTMSDVRVMLGPGSLVIRSPGSFPPGVDPESPEHVPRNPLLCSYLYDTGYIERYGFGLRKIREAVAAHPMVEVRFEVTPARVDVVFERRPGKALTEDEQRVLSLLERGPASSSGVAEVIGVSKPTALKRLRRLEELGLVERIGRGRGSLFRLRS